MFSMCSRRLLTILAFLALTTSLRAQEARSMGIGGGATAAPIGIFGIYWNPSLLALPDASPSGWTVASGFSAFDTNNAGKPIIHFQPNDGLQSGQDPVQRFQQYLGLLTVKYITTAGGVVWDQDLNYLASQSALQFFHDRNNGGVAALSTYNNLNYQQTNQQYANLVLSYGASMPLGSLPLFTIGGTLKYHDGLQYEQDSLTGNYSQVTPGSGYTYTKTTSNSGLGLSTDLGFLAKLTDSIAVGMMFENISSNFTWTATQQNYTLDGTGQEHPSGSPQSVNVSTPFPYATKLGFMLNPPDKDIILEGEVAWSQQQARWRFGMERFYPEANLAVRFGTFADQISNQQLWCFGIGYMSKIVNIDAALLTRNIPDLQNSLALGGALDAVIVF